MQTFHEALEHSVLERQYVHLVEQPPLFERLTKKLFEWFGHALVTIYCRLSVQGRENLPESPFIFCSNHNSHMDTVVLMVSSGLPFKRFGMMAASDYFFNGKRTFMGLLMNLIPVNRQANFKSIVTAMVACRAFTKNGGRNLIIYPEGTRSVNGEIQSFKNGAAVIATELKLPIVPVYIKGTHESMPKGKSFIRPRKIRAIIGKPIYPEKLTHERRNGNPLANYRLLTGAVRAEICNLRERMHHVN
ncbi:MAG: lysophospholipid acyltransferase family protein [bacterium]